MKYVSRIPSLGAGNSGIWILLCVDLGLLIVAAKGVRYALLDSSRATRGTWPDDGPASGFGAVPTPGSMKEDSVAHLEDLRFRLASHSDAESIAALHAYSWRRSYRGAYSDSFLDGDVVADRVTVWSERLREPDLGRSTILAEDRSGTIAFAHTAFDDHPTWGALLDNLHVAHAYKRRGIASQLLLLTARAVIERGAGLYLWVLEQNVEARAFYEARGARLVDPAVVLDRVIDFRTSSGR
jgi:GNAT superfamily N-acetyltransferase